MFTDEGNIAVLTGEMWELELVIYVNKSSTQQVFITHSAWNRFFPAGPSHSLLLTLHNGDGAQ